MGKEETDAAHYRIGDRVFERGNFAFIYEKTENRELFLEFLNAEKNAEINYQDSLAGFRRGIEGLSYYLGLLQKNGKKPTSEEIKAAMKENESRGPRYSENKSTENEETPDSIGTVSGSLQRRFSPKSIAVYSWKLLMLQGADPEMTGKIINPGGYGEQLKKRISEIYSEASDNGSHFSAELGVDLNQFTEKVYTAAQLMLLSDISEWNDVLRKRYKRTLRPVGKYYPLTKEEKKALGGIKGTWQKDLYYCPDDIAPAFYLLWRHSSVQGRETTAENSIRALREKRRVENAILTERTAGNSAYSIKPDHTIEKHGERSDGSREVIDIFRLPGKPFALSKWTLSGMNESTKCGICRGMMAIVEDMHAAGAAHRVLLPSSFCLCDTPGGILPVLTDFAASKNYESTDDEEGTVICSQNFNFCSAPEFYQEIGAGDFSHSKMMDVYSLGVIMEYILSGGDELLWRDAEKRKSAPDLSCLSIPERYIPVLSEMTKENPEERISLKEAEDRFRVVSGFDLSFSYFSAKGKREKQEDALFVNETVCQGGDTDLFGNKKTCLHACAGVFDGIGFAGNGREIAEKAAELFCEKKKKGMSLDTAAEETEEELGSYMEDNSCFDGGCTIAAVEIERNEVHIISAGDSSIFLYADGLLTRLTEPDRIDYRGPGGSMRHELSMYLGISLTEGIPFSPHSKKAGFRMDSRIFICTDGAEAVLGEDNIVEAFKTCGSISEAAQKMAAQIREAEPKDNATFIIAGWEERNGRKGK